MRGNVRARVLAAALALVLGLLAYAQALDPGRQLAGRDLFHLFYPLGKVVAGSAREGGLLRHARDPSRGLGVALVADPLAWSFYPPRVLHAAFDYDLAFKLVLLLHGSLAGLGSFALARALGASPRASLLALVGAVLAGPVLSLHRHPNLLAGAAWAPFVVAFFLEAETSSGGSRRARLALAGACLGLMLLAAGIELVLGLALVFLVLVLAGALRARGLAARARPLAASCLVLALGGGLAAIQLVPTLEWLPSTLRPGAVTASEAYAWSLSPGRLPGLVLRALDASFVAGNRPYLPTGRPFSESVYLGVAVVALSVRGAVAGSRRTRALGFAMMLVLLLSLGGSGLVLPFLRVLPVYDRFRYPEKIVLLVAVLLPALAAVGLEGLLRSTFARARPRARAAVAAALVALTAGDLMRGRSALIETVPVSWLHEAPDTVAFLGTGRFLAGPGVLAGVDPPDAGESGENEAFLGPVRHHRRVLAGGLAGLYSKEDASEYGPFAPSRLASLMKVTRVEETFADLASLDTFLARPTSGYARIWRSEPIPGKLVVARPRAGPRVRLVPVARRTTEKLAPKALDDIASLDREACFEGETDEIKESGSPGEARIVERDADHVLVRTSAPGKRLLVLSELFLEGTRAEVDERSAPVVAADIALTGVPVEPGEHTVRVTFHVPGLALGAAITLASIACALALALVPSRKTG